MQKHISKKSFYTLSWTWGLPMTLIGLIVVASILLYGVVRKKHYRLKRHGWCYYLNVGKSWGGMELGMFFLTDSNNSVSVKWHEFGHAIQNCTWGPLMPFVICIPSAIRYWYRELRYNRKGLTCPTKYDDIWFEGEATTLGRTYRKIIREGK